ncbi:ModD protein [Roseospira marina]|uniref:Putative pyrophosphorylase ModD n=1 Tax=Roseospira marina TaxID=140057 RepID=A0A5M6IDJ1_9PROT|nr:ModD protein [Roseospira marina]KAA5605795.1 ModD protein [Roseospira marina]MBB4313609.1 molybdenum transport protein [Roseospira marina]MBB5086771.1 molybdenum transport protein [Roseospira marina]
MRPVLDDASLWALLREDAPYGDLTTRALDLNTVPARLTAAARDPMVLCGVEESARLLELVGATVTRHAVSGDRLEADAPILAAEGPAEALLLGWKVAQTLMEWSSGVATRARAIVDAARAVRPDTVVACTRKSVPGTRVLSAKAVLAGRASLHRTGLSDTVLLFPEHRAVGGGPEALGGQIATLRHACPERSIVVEVKSVDEALAAARHGADVLQLEKFTPDAVADVLARLSPASPARIAAAGGVNAANAADYVRAGARILVTSAPYTAPPADVGVVITAA